MRTRSRIGDLLVEQALEHALDLAEAELRRSELLDDDGVAALDDVGEQLDVLAAEQASGVRADDVGEVRGERPTRGRRR